jgi:hypothetical protein
MADKFECKYCGLPVAKVATPVKFWGKGEPPEEWIHTKSSQGGVIRCDRHFLKVGEVVRSDSQVPVQD